MITCNDIRAFLDQNYNYTDTLSNLSNNEQIKSAQIAYDYDKIKGAIYREQCLSADALLIKNNINLIEFKTGFDSPDDTLSEQIKKENLKLSIRVKTYESLHLLQTSIIEETKPNDQLAPNIKTVFCAVIDTNEPAVADETYVDILSDEGGNRENKSFKAKIIENILSFYRKETDRHKKLFYDDAFVLYDYEFDSKVSVFK